MDAKNKKKTIAYGVILAFCTLFVIIDNTLMSPQSTHAGSAETPPSVAAPTPLVTPTASLSAPSSTPTPTPSSTPSPTRVAVARRLADFAENAHAASTIPDAFAPPADWLPKEPTTPQPATPDGTPAPRRPKPHNLTLNAVMIDSQGGVAVIKGKPLRVGQAVEGYTLQTIGEDRVTLTHEGFTISLSLDKPDLERP